MAALWRRFSCTVMVVGLSLCPVTGVAADPARITAIEPGAVLVLDATINNSARVKLEGLLVPTRPASLAKSIQAHLKQIALGRIAEITGQRLDRHHRLVSQVYLGGEAWLQQDLLLRGYARVLLSAEEDAPFDRMLTLEDQARRDRLGLWRYDKFQVFADDQIDAPLSSYQLITGRVHEVAEVRGKTYINFDQDWRSDFTIIIEPAVRRRFLADGRNPADFVGKRVRVRGWLESYNGPMIRLRHPLEIELLDDHAGSD